MRTTLLIPALATMMLLMAPADADAQPVSAPEAPSVDLPGLDDIKNEGERRRKAKRSKKRRDRDHADDDRRSRRGKSSSRSSRSRSRGGEAHAHRSHRRSRHVHVESRRQSRRAYRDHQRRRTWRTSRHHHHHRRVIVHREPAPVIVVAPEPEPVVVTRSAPRPKRAGATAGWRHIGGGFGSAWVPDFGAATPAGRFEMGAGGYTVGLYGGGGLEIAGNSATPVSFTGVGYVGMAIPVPVVHPLIGVKVGGGGHVDHEGPGPQVSVGPQAGFILRPHDGDLGLRVMFDLDLVYKPTKRELAPQAMLTFSGVF